MSILFVLDLYIPTRTVTKLLHMLLLLSFWQTKTYFSLKYGNCVFRYYKPNKRPNISMWSNTNEQPLDY